MIASTLNALVDFPAKLEAYYSEIPIEFRNWQPASWHGIPSEPFAAIEQICHVRDVEIEGYHVRFRRALEESNPDLPDLDGESLARERDYPSANAADVFASFRAARTSTIQLIGTLTPAQLGRTAQFNGASASVLSLVHYLCSHDQQHLAGLQWLLARIRGQRVSG